MRPETPDLFVGSAMNGKGVFTKNKILPRTVIFEIKGEYLSPSEIESEGVYSPKSANAYRFSSDLYISPGENLGAFLNHSCEPNAYISKVDNKLYVNAIDLILRDMEILIDYSTIMALDDKWTMEYHCGNTHCRGVVRRFVDLPTKTQVAYKDAGIVPEYILDYLEIRS